MEPPPQLPDLGSALRIFEAVPLFDRQRWRLLGYGSGAPVVPSAGIHGSVSPRLAGPATGSALATERVSYEGALFGGVPRVCRRRKLWMASCARRGHGALVRREVSLPQPDSSPIGLVTRDSSVNSSRIWRVAEFLVRTVLPPRSRTLRRAVATKRAVIGASVHDAPRHSTGSTRSVTGSRNQIRDISCGSTWNGAARSPSRK